MCVDDYQFRHHSATRQKICRRFVFRTTDGFQRTFLVNISQFQRFDNLCLCEILMHLNKKGLNIKDYQFYLPKLNITIEAGDKCLIPFNLMVDKEVILQMKCIPQEINWGVLTSIAKPQMQEQNIPPLAIEIEQQQFECVDCQNCEAPVLKQTQQNYPMSNNSDGLSNIQNSSEWSRPSKKHSTSSKKPAFKRTKQHEKTVQQALYKTKYWRMLHEVGNFSLKNAANFVGVSKKTLDDYFLVLRVGEELGYDYEANLKNKIGHLRNFIRSQPIKVRGRMNKGIQSFKLVPEPNIDPYIPIKNWQRLEHVNEVHHHQGQQQDNESLDKNSVNNTFSETYSTRSTIKEQRIMSE